MTTHVRSLLVLLVLTLVCVQMPGADPETANRFHAAWKVDQFGGLGDVYYFYPDGLYVRQGVRRREFVTIGRWKLEPQNQLVLFEQQPLHTTLSAEKLEAIKKEVLRYAISFEANNRMSWKSDNPSTAPLVLMWLKPLPDRTEKPYWGLGTAESYDRGRRRAAGLECEKPATHTEQSAPKKSSQHP